jgi:hypothetical protein
MSSRKESPRNPSGVQNQSPKGNDSVGTHNADSRAVLPEIVLGGTCPARPKCRPAPDVRISHCLKKAISLRRAVHARVEATLRWLDQRRGRFRNTRTISQAIAVTRTCGDTPILTGFPVPQCSQIQANGLTDRPHSRHADTSCQHRLAKRLPVLKNVREVSRCMMSNIWIPQFWPEEGTPTGSPENVSPDEPA